MMQRAMHWYDSRAARFVIAGMIAVLVILADARVAAQPDAPALQALTLTDQDGRSTSLSAFRGRTLLVSFIFTQCPTACPTQTRGLAGVQAALPASVRRRVQFVSVSIDPEHDSPAALKRFAETMKADTVSWSFVTAPRATIDALTNGLGISVMRQPEAVTDHALHLLLFDANGTLRQRFAGGAIDPPRLVREIETVDRLFGSRTPESPQVR